MLMVSCSSASTVMEHRIDSGIETAMISVERQLPRNTRIITAVRQAAIMASRTTPLIDGAHEDGLVGRAIDPQLRRQLALDVFDPVAHVLDDLQRRGRPRLHDRHHDGALSVHAYDIRLRWVAIAHMGHVAHVNHRSIYRLDRKIVQLLHHRGRGVRLDRVLKPVHLHGAGGNNQILRRDRVHHVGRRQTVCLQGLADRYPP